MTSDHQRIQDLISAVSILCSPYPFLLRKSHSCNICTSYKTVSEAGFTLSVNWQWWGGMTSKQARGKKTLNILKQHACIRKQPRAWRNLFACDKEMSTCDPSSLVAVVPMMLTDVHICKQFSQRVSFFLLLEACSGECYTIFHSRPGHHFVKHQAWFATAAGINPTGWECLI